MKASVLLLIFCVAVIILLCYTEESHAVVFVLSRGKIRGLSNFKRSSIIKRKKKQRLKRLKRRKKHHKSSQKYRDIRRWLKRFKHKRKWLKKMLKKSGEKKSKQ